MIITQIEDQKKSKDRVSLYIDDKFAFGIHREILMKYNIKEGMVVEEEYVNTILKKEEQNKANNYALHLLSYAIKSELELKRKLTRKGFEEDIIENTMEFLKGYNLVNDKDYAERFVKDKINFYKVGTNVIKQGLYLKGIDKEIIAETIEQEVSEEKEYEVALELARKKIKSYEKDDKNKKYRKLGSFLQRKGFTFDVVSKVLKEVLKVEDIY